ncbi:MAG: nucleotidyl transferase AbiEii/AbiGii toxin family protein [Candidatus Obscuribacterales bacterium]
MIDKREILEAASTLSLLPNVVEKDYVLGWILGGIHANPVLANGWVFKGGTCLKKCYFETYRFSEDLDFTIREPRHIDQEFLKTQLTEVVRWVADQSGLNIPEEQIWIDIYDNPRGKPSCQGKIGYRGPVSSTTGGWPKIKIDLTADEKIVLPSVKQPVFHPYSDAPAEGIWTNCYAYEEAFAEKVRALGERTRPRDLYDVVNLYRHTDARPSAGVLRDVLNQKCQFKSIDVPTFEALVSHRIDLEAKWAAMLGHQLPVLPLASDFWDALPEIFRWIHTGAQSPELTIMRPGSQEEPIYSRTLPMSIPLRTRPALETIRFAAANYLCVDLIYENKTRRIEPYSLRRTADGDYLLHSIRSDSGEHRSYRLDRIQGASVTSQSFSPRYVIELTATGSVPVAEATAKPRSSSTGPRRTQTSSRRASSGSGGPTYIFRCSSCNKTFRRKSMDSSMNSHKNRSGYSCYGHGVYVKTTY